MSRTGIMRGTGGRTRHGALTGATRVRDMDKVFD